MLASDAFASTRTLRVESIANSPTIAAAVEAATTPLTMRPVYDFGCLLPKV